MIRYIFASKGTNQQKFEPGTMINKVGRYLSKNIDGAYKLEFHPMDCEVYMRMYYQVPGSPDSFDEMKFFISITSYSNKLRINLTEDTEMEKTIGQLILFPDELYDLDRIKKRVLTMIRKSINKEFAEFDFVY